MSQGEVLKYLEENGKSTADEMAEQLNISRSAITKNLLALKKQDLVTFIKQQSKFGKGKAPLIWMVKE